MGDVNPFFWSGVVPPKVDLFIWMLAKGRVLVGDLLPKFTGGLIKRQLCPFCMKTVESIKHLFLSCYWSWVLWSNCMDWWGISACIPADMRMWMDGWMLLCPAASSGRVWKVAFHAIYWTIWENRNDVVFNHGKADSVKAVEMVW
ncbi:hypothetical protein Dsin_011705 [Dipteronia sinensis]|uniref:Reverse transcriptase zinc-binding domain-containing protein n=1 Tax=Dipteronia sinensis TaxID=43782 RepID=A0AAE0E8Q8_9ROSI|nr:hypothetical protein Dsin_011705 [Dipteronia sinensis]